MNGNEAFSNVHNDTNSTLGRDFHSVYYWSESLSLQELLNGNEALSSVLVEGKSSLGRDFL